MCVLSAAIAVSISVVRPPVPRKLSVRSAAFNMEIWIPAITRQQMNGHRKTINITINVFTAVIPISMKQTVPAVQLPVPKKPPVPCAAIHMVQLGTHCLSHQEEKAATCTEAGNIAYWHCSVCMKNFLDQAGRQEASNVALPVLEHTYGEWTVTKAPTSLETGIKTKSCVFCGHTITESTLLPATVINFQSGFSCFF